MSEYFEWNVSTYGIKVPAMDREHEILIAYMNTLHSLHLSGAARAALAKALADLVAYTGKHFTDEEAYMARIAFPQLKTHALIHKQMLERIGVFAAEFEQTGVLTEDFFAFLKMWLKAHICGIDVKYARVS